MSAFLLGGARSGKSSLAEQLAVGLDLPVIAVVTAEPIDAEMRDRIERHRSDRPTGWLTVEAPYDLVETVAGLPPEQTVVVDCVTVWLSNLLVGGERPEEIEAKGRTLARVLADRGGPSIAVSNEIGLGIVPGDPMSRSFRDIQGRVNQALAAALDYSYLVVAGQLLALESSADVLAVLRAEYSTPSRIQRE